MLVLSWHNKLHYVIKFFFKHDLHCYSFESFSVSSLQPISWFHLIVISTEWDFFHVNPATFNAWNIARQSWKEPSDRNCPSLWWAIKVFTFCNVSNPCKESWAIQLTIMCFKFWRKLHDEPNEVQVLVLSFTNWKGRCSEITNFWLLFWTLCFKCREAGLWHAHCFDAQRCAGKI